MTTCLIKKILVFSVQHIAYNITGCLGNLYEYVIDIPDVEKQQYKIYSTVYLNKK